MWGTKNKIKNLVYVLFGMFVLVIMFSEPFNFIAEDVAKNKEVSYKETTITEEEIDSDFDKILDTMRIKNITTHNIEYTYDKEKLWELIVDKTPTDIVKIFMDSEYKELQDNPIKIIEEKSYNCYSSTMLIAEWLNLNKSPQKYGYKIMFNISDNAGIGHVNLVIKPGGEEYIILDIVDNPNKSCEQFLEFVRNLREV